MKFHIKNIIPYSISQLKEVEQYPTVKCRKNHSLTIVLHFLMIVSIILLVYLGLHHYSHGVMINLFLLAVALLLEILHYKFKSTILISTVGSICLIIVFCTSFLTDTNPEIGMDAYWLWLLMFPFLVNYFAGIVYGSCLMIIGFICSVIMMWSPLRSRFYYYGTDMLTYFPIIYLCMMVVAALVQYEITTYQIQIRIDEEHRKKAEENKISSLREQIEVYEENATTLKKCQHDMRHHNRILLTFLKNKELSEAEKYIGQIEENLEYITATQYCENHIINGILMIYAAKSEKKHICFRVKTCVPDKLIIKESELAALLSNVLENAVESCEKVKDGQLQIYININYQEGHLSITVKNSCGVSTEFSEDGLPVSTKEHSSGIGTKSILDIAEKYDGYALFEESKSQFITQIKLNC